MYWKKQNKDAKQKKKLAKSIPHLCLNVSNHTLTIQPGKKDERK